MIAPGWGLEARLDYWSKSYRWGFDEAGLEYSVRDIAFAALAKRTLATQNEKLAPYVGGGLAFHLIKGGLSAFAGDEADDAADSTVKLGMSFLFLMLGGWLAVSLV